jgi:excisionase family DNA binding protein
MEAFMNIQVNPIFDGILLTDIFAASEAAELLGISVSHFNRLVQKGKLPGPIDTRIWRSDWHACRWWRAYDLMTPLKDRVLNHMYFLCQHEDAPHPRLTQIAARQKIIGKIDGPLAMLEAQAERLTTEEIATQIARRDERCLDRRYGRDEPSYIPPAPNASARTSPPPPAPKTRPRPAVPPISTSSEQSKDSLEMLRRLGLGDIDV